MRYVVIWLRTNGLELYRTAATCYPEEAEALFNDWCKEAGMWMFNLTGLSASQKLICACGGDVIHAVYMGGGT
jgi:hypothetical protein